MAHTQQAKYRRSFKGCLLWAALLMLCLTSWAQVPQTKQFQFTKSRKKISIPIEIVNNLVLVKAQINESDTMRFILDSGVGYTMITDLYYASSFNLKLTREINLFGLGMGDTIKALHAINNIIHLPGGIVGRYQDILVPLQDIFQLSSSMGTRVNGLLGYDFFSSFPVEINYKRKELIVYNPEKFHKIRKRMVRRGSLLPLYIDNRKPYLNAYVSDGGGGKYPVRLLIDSGASKALSLYSEENENIRIPEKAIESYLGMGLSGAVFGSIGRIDAIQIDGYVLKEPVVTFPDSSSIKMAMGMGSRDGSIGAEILKRFKAIFNYRDNEIILRPSGYFKDRFTFNMSGMEVVTPIPGFPIYQIAEVRKGSPAYRAGFREGDQILGINGTNITRYDLNDIIELMHSKAGRRVKMVVARNGLVREGQFKLKDPI